MSSQSLATTEGHRSAHTRQPRGGYFLSRGEPACFPGHRTRSKPYSSVPQQVWTSHSEPFSEAHRNTFDTSSVCGNGSSQSIPGTAVRWGQVDSRQLPPAWSVGAVTLAPEGSKGQPSLSLIERHPGDHALQLWSTSTRPKNTSSLSAVEKQLHAAPPAAKEHASESHRHLHLLPLFRTPGCPLLEAVGRMDSSCT